MSESAWRVLDGEGNEQGPYSFEDLQGYFTAGNINHETMVWTEGLEEWIPAGQVEGLLPAVPQVVELAVAQPAPTGPAPTTSGMDLTPQVSGVATSGELAKPSLPSWISLTTLLIGIVALVLFFLPWVSVSMDTSQSEKVEMVKAVTQSGLQATTQKQTVTSKFIAAYAKESGISVDEAQKELDEAEQNPILEDNYDSSKLILTAMIAVGLGLVLALIGFINKGRVFSVIAQFTFIVAALLIGIQMAQQFPLIKKITDGFEGTMEVSEKTINEIYESVSEIDPTKAAIEKAAALQELQNARSSIKTGFEPSCFAAVGILGFSLLLIVVTMSSGGSPPIVIPQPGETTTQPGGGIKFH